MTWVEDETCKGKMRNSYNTFIGKPEGEKPVVGRMILKWFLEKQGEKVWTRFI
jgi:hypothetical protein